MVSDVYGSVQIGVVPELAVEEALIDVNRILRAPLPPGGYICIFPLGLLLSLVQVLNLLSLLRSK